MRKKLGVKKTW